MSFATRVMFARFGQYEYVVQYATYNTPRIAYHTSYTLRIPFPTRRIVQHRIFVLATLLQAVDPKTDGAARDWVAIYDECARILYQEIDYRVEGESADQFAQNFKEMDWVKVPNIYWDYT
eukprot:6085674-Pyramimonas_sp.AAC.1